MQCRGPGNGDSPNNSFESLVLIERPTIEDLPWLEDAIFIHHAECVLAILDRNSRHHSQILKPAQADDFHDALQVWFFVNFEASTYHSNRSSRKAVGVVLHTPS
jgi:hypothetical protein